jgi:hypothetical protein
LPVRTKSDEVPASLFVPKIPSLHPASSLDGKYGKWVFAKQLRRFFENRKNSAQLRALPGVSSGMKPDPDGHNSHLDEQDPVWDLLARARQPEPDVWFTAKTLARCRRMERPAKSSWSLFGHVWRWAIGGGLGVCLAAVLAVPQMQPSRPVTTDQKGVQEAFEVVATLKSDSDSSSTSSTWQDSSL